MAKDNEAAKTTKGGDMSRQRLLDAAVDLFAEQGFAGSSVRDLARETGMSLAGLYHHFTSKDEILFEIQKQSFQQLLGPLADVRRDGAPVKRLQAFVKNHIEFFSKQQTKMKLLSHELGALSGEYGSEIGLLRSRYYRICLEAVTDLMAELGRTDLDAGVATMSLFGMINWIYTWYPRATDPRPDLLAEQMLDLFLHGVTGGIQHRTHG